MIRVDPHPLVGRRARGVAPNGEAMEGEIVAVFARPDEEAVVSIRDDAAPRRARAVMARDCELLDRWSVLAGPAVTMGLLVLLTAALALYIGGPPELLDVLAIWTMVLLLFAAASLIAKGVQHLVAHWERRP